MSIKLVANAHKPFKPKRNRRAGNSNEINNSLGGSEPTLNGILFCFFPFFFVSEFFFGARSFCVYEIDLALFDISPFRIAFEFQRGRHFISQSQNS